jgi:hypothetical protein
MNDGNWNLGKMKDQPYYAVYNDKFLEGNNTFECTVAGSELAESHMDDELTNNSKSQSCPIVLFWLGDFDLYAAHGYDYNATIATMGDIFNNVSALYQQEGVQLLLGSCYAYVSPDGYSETDLVGTFLDFGYNIHQDPNFQGHDLAMFIALDATNTPSGYAVIDALCTTDFYYNASLGVDYTEGRFAYSRIQNYHYDYPIFSNTVLKWDII